MSAIYNEIDPFAARWLEELVDGGHVAMAHGERDRWKDHDGAGSASRSARRPCDRTTGSVADDDARGWSIERAPRVHADGPRRDDAAGCGEAGSGRPWDRCEWIPCRDGVYRPIEPGTFPLADGVPGRVGRLRGYGNAIVPQVAARFIRAALGGRLT